MGDTPWYRRAPWRIVAFTLSAVGLSASHTLAVVLCAIAAPDAPGVRHDDPPPPLLLSDLAGIAMLYGVAMWAVGALRTRLTFRFAALALAAVTLPAVVWTLPEAILGGVRAALSLGFELSLCIGALVAAPLLTAGLAREIALRASPCPSFFVHLLLPAMAGTAAIALGASVVQGFDDTHAARAAALSVMAVLVAYLIDLGAGEQGRTFSSAAAPGTESTLP